MADDAGAGADRQREVRLRRVAAGMGLAVRKSRARDTSRMDFGCYRIEGTGGCPVAGNYPYPFSLSLDGLEEALEHLAENPPEMGCTEDGKIIHGVAGAADPNWGR